jgi:hypothetical protein
MIMNASLERRQALAEIIREKAEAFFKCGQSHELQADANHYMASLLFKEADRLNPLPIGSFDPDHASHGDAGSAEITSSGTWKPEAARASPVN